MRKAEFTTTLASLKDIFVDIETNKFSFDTYYQNHCEWESDLKEALIVSVFTGFPIGSTIVYEDGVKKVIIDGIQRIQTLIDFYQGRLILSPKTGKKIAEFFSDELMEYHDRHSNRILKKLSNKTFPKLSFHQLPEMMQEYFLNYLVPIVVIDNVNPSSVVFSVIHNEEKYKCKQLAKIIPSNPLSKILPNEQFKELATLLGFNQFDELMKILLQFHGIYNNQLLLGASDNSILKYSKKIVQVTPSFEFYVKKFYQKLIEEDFKQHPIELNKSIIKLIFILIFFDETWKECSISTMIQNVSLTYKTYKSKMNSNVTTPNNTISDFINLTQSTHSKEEIERIVNQLNVVDTFYKNK